VEETKKHKQSLDAFDSRFSTRWRDPVRRSAIDEVETVSQAVINQAKAKTSEIEFYTAVYGSKAVLIQAYHTPKTRQYSITTDMVEKDDVEFYITHGIERGLLYCRVAVFENLIQGLKADIREGKRDQHLHESATQLMYRKMLDSVTR